MQLSEHFSLQELTRSSKAEALGLDNTPGPIELENLKFTAKKLEEVRAALGNNPLVISSGYRSLAVNKAVGSKAKHSQHMDGQAVDFTCPKFGTPKEIVDAIRESGIEYDQLIHEFNTWVHISFTKAANRKQALVIDNNGTRAYA